MLVIGPIGGARADTVPVHGLKFPMGSPLQLSYVACSDLYASRDKPKTLRPVMTYDAGLGTRSVDYTLPKGYAVGTLAYVSSVRDTTDVGLEVRDGGTGVAYVVYQTKAQRDTTRLWVGRASLTAGSGWQTVQAADETYTWRLYDGATGTVVPGSSTVTKTVSDFTAAQGDGAGLFTVGFGCDGNTFGIDGLRLGDTVEDLEGLVADVGISASRDTVEKGKPVFISGSLHDSTGAPISRGVLVLEQSTDGGATWTPARVVDASSGSVSATVTPTQDTEYRFHFADRDLAPGAYSGTVSVSVRGAGASHSASPSATPSPTASDTPSASPSEKTTEPSATASSTPSPTPSSTSSSKSSTKSSPSATSSPSPQKSTTPSSKPSPTTSPSPSGTSSSSPDASPDASTGASPDASADADTTRSGGSSVLPDLTAPQSLE